MSNQIERGTAVVVHFQSGRDFEGVVEEWGDSVILFSRDGSASLFIPDATSVESVEIQSAVEEEQPSLNKRLGNRNIIDGVVAPLSKGYSTAKYGSLLRKR
jgi:hypothetical protein